MKWNYKIKMFSLGVLPLFAGSVIIPISSYNNNNNNKKNDYSTDGEYYATTEKVAEMRQNILINFSRLSKAKQAEYDDIILKSKNNDYLNFCDGIEKIYKNNDNLTLNQVYHNLIELSQVANLDICDYNDQYDTLKINLEESLSTETYRKRLISLFNYCKESCLSLTDYQSKISQFETSELKNSKSKNDILTIANSDLRQVFLKTSTKTRNDFKSINNQTNSISNNWQEIKPFKNQSCVQANADWMYVDDIVNKYGNGKPEDCIGRNIDYDDYQRLAITNTDTNFNYLPDFSSQEIQDNYKVRIKIKNISYKGLNGDPVDNSISLIYGLTPKSIGEIKGWEQYTAWSDMDEFEKYNPNFADQLYEEKERKTAEVFYSQDCKNSMQPIQKLKTSESPYASINRMDQKICELVNNYKPRLVVNDHIGIEDYMNLKDEYLYYDQLKKKSIDSKISEDSKDFQYLTDPISPILITFDEDSWATETRTHDEVKKDFDIFFSKYAIRVQINDVNKLTNEVQFRIQIADLNPDTSKKFDDESAYIWYNASGEAAKKVAVYTQGKVTESRNFDQKLSQKLKLINEACAFVGYSNFMTSQNSVISTQGKSWYKILSLVLKYVLGAGDITSSVGSADKQQEPIYWDWFGNRYDDIPYNDNQTNIALIKKDVIISSIRFWINLIYLIWLNFEANRAEKFIKTSSVGSPTGLILTGMWIVWLILLAVAGSSAYIYIMAEIFGVQQDDDYIYKHQHTAYDLVQFGKQKVPSYIDEKSTEAKYLLESAKVLNDFTTGVGKTNFDKFFKYYVKNDKEEEISSDDLYSFYLSLGRVSSTGPSYKPETPMDAWSYLNAYLNKRYYGTKNLAFDFETINSKGIHNAFWEVTGSNRGLKFCPLNIDVAASYAILISGFLTTTTIVGTSLINAIKQAVGAGTAKISSNKLSQYLNDDGSFKSEAAKLLSEYDLNYPQQWAAGYLNGSKTISYLKTFTGNLWGEIANASGFGIISCFLSWFSASLYKWLSYANHHWATCLVCAAAVIALGFAVKTSAADLLAGFGDAQIFVENCVSNQSFVTVI